MAGGGKDVGVEEAAKGRIIIPGLEVIETCFGVVDIYPVAQGVMDTEGGSHGAGGNQKLTPSVVSIADF